MFKSFFFLVLYPCSVLAIILKVEIFSYILSFNYKFTVFRLTKMLNNVIIYSYGDHTSIVKPNSHLAIRDYCVILITQNYTITKGRFPFS